MSREWTGVEVLAIAERMEQNAERFYRRAAGMYEDARISKLFSDLAQWEKRHIEVFAEMKKRLSQQGWGIGQYGAERSSFSRPQMPIPVFSDGTDPAEALTGRETRAELLRKAIEKEKEAIEYYASLKDFVPDKEDAQAVKEILDEEQRHVRILTQSLEGIA
ncbi:MAG TPA: ferritin family protein [Sedimentisphaerales bacterium]|nr:ferritin family protein [Sedimentisphaerales bacterium]